MAAQMNLERWVESSGIPWSELLTMDNLLQGLPGWVQSRVRTAEPKGLKDFLRTVARVVAGSAPTAGKHKVQGPTPVVDRMSRRAGEAESMKEVDSGSKQPGERKCFQCHQPGHFRRDCPLNKSIKKEVNLVQHAEPDRRFHLEVQVNQKHTATALLDTGAGIAVVSPKLVEPKDYTGEHLMLNTVAGRQPKPLAKVNIRTGEHSQDLTVAVAEIQTRDVDLLLGPTDFELFHELLHQKTDILRERPVEAVTRAQARRNLEEEEALEQAQLQDGAEIEPLEESEPDSLENTEAGEENEVVETADELEPVPPLECSDSDQEQSDSEGGLMPKIHSEQQPRQSIPWPTKAELEQAQKEDPTLSYFRQKARKGKHPFYRRDGLLWRKPRDGGEHPLILVPQKLRQRVLKFAHSSPGAGHFADKKTLDRVRQRFDWPGIHREVKETCASCPECQRAKPPTTPLAPLQSLPVIGVPFQRVAMDIFGPLRRTKNGNKYVLVIMDYATKWPEAFPLRNVESQTVVRCLLDLTSRFGVPQEILTDNGSNFTSKTMEQFCALAGLSQIHTSPYHPQTDGMVERFNATIKRMLMKLQQKGELPWDECLPFVLWAYRGATHASTGYSPHELLFGRKMRTLLDELADRWSEVQEFSGMDVLHYLEALRDKLDLIRQIATEEEKQAKASQKKHHDAKAKPRSFQVGDFVLAVQPRRQKKLEIEWNGPFQIQEKKSDTTYVLDMDDRARSSTSTG